MKYFYLILVLCVLGCSPSGAKLVPVEGMVTKDGKPLVDVRLEFHTLRKYPSFRAAINQHY